VQSDDFHAHSRPWPRTHATSSTSSAPAGWTLTTDRPALPDEVEALDLPPTSATVWVIERTYYAAGVPVETATIVLPRGRYELVYRVPVL
jgi:hypothetical protein